MPAFMAALHGQPESPPVANSLVMITFDAVAHRLCVRQHKAHLCVLDSFETTKLGATPPRTREVLSLQQCGLANLAAAQAAA